jgi:cytochrome P450
MPNEMANHFSYEGAPMSQDRTIGWEYVRSQGEVFEADGTWYLTSYEAVRFAHRHPEIFSSAKAFDVLGSPVPLIPIASDPPDHVRYRRILDPMLAPRVINQMEDELRLQARGLIENFVDRGSCDVVTEVARLYPTQVFLTTFGLPQEDRDQFIDWAEKVIENSSASGAPPNQEVMTAAIAIFGYLQGFIDQKRAHPGDDMLSKVLSLKGDDAWTGDEVLGMCFLFILAGLDTVAAVIGFVMLHLAREETLRKSLVADPSRVPATIEEILRLELPAPITPRVTTTEVEVCGVTIPAGANVQICIATANRDGAVFVEPDLIRVEHGDRAHLSFGGGIHRCLGSHLARRELRLVVEEFHRLIPDYQIAPGVTPSLVWPSSTLHLRELPLIFPTKGAV